MALIISFVANADMSHLSSCNFSDVFVSTTDRYQYSGMKEPQKDNKSTD